MINFKVLVKMKKVLFLLACLFMYGAESFSQKLVETDYYLNNPTLGGDVVIKKNTKEVNGDNAITSFEVEVSNTGEYYASFWMFPTKLKDGTFASYDVAVNGNVLTEKLNPTVGDWQSLSLSNNGRIFLKKGANIVSVIGKVPDVPNVEHVKFSVGYAQSRINDNAYKEYKTEVSSESAKFAEDNAKRVQVLSADTLSNEYAIMPYAASSEASLNNYTYALSVPLKYTFYKTVSFTKGQQIFIATNGVDNFEHILEVFSSNKPESYSWSAMSNSNCMASLILTVPETGLYYVRVRSYLNARSGLCNLNINGENYYDNIPIYSVGVRCTQETDKVYNTFTCYKTGNPRLWIEEGNSIPGKIYAYNDDYGTKGDFSWGLNSRIKRQYSRPVHAALLSSYASYNPSSSCDLYVKCQNSTITSYFPNLKEDDAIQSAPASTTYNCISWSGGITSYWEWPLSYGSNYYSSNPLTAFDNFYASRGLTRTGATESNAVVALWAVVDQNGNRTYTHGSVRKGADSNAHGYDWESKPGSLMRTFHPKNALNGASYGQIVEYYTKANTAATTLAEEIADGSAQIEYVDFTSDEDKLINQKIGEINSGVLAKFKTLYNEWKNVTETTIFSNPEQIANCKEYKDLLGFCKENLRLQYALYKELGQGDGISAIKPIEDLTINQYGTIMESVREENNIATQTCAGIKTIRSLHSNYMAYVKEILSKDKVDIQKSRKATRATTGLSYSNFKEFSVLQGAGNLSVEFSLSNASKVSLNTLDLAGNIVSSAFTEHMLESGPHIFKLPIEKKGMYLVQLVIDGRVNVKKVILK